MLTEKQKTGKHHVRTIAVTSGKGGVGKTNVVANLAIALTAQGKKVMILDADLGLSNIDVLLHLAPHYNIQHVLSGELTLRDVLVEGPHGIRILPASSGMQELTTLDEFQRLKIMEEFDAYDEDIDVVLIDTAAGISENVAFFCIAAQEIVIVTSPEPTAITDAYALIKVLSTRYHEKEFRVLVNCAKNMEEGREVFRRLSRATEKFLNISLDYLGHLPFDEGIPKAVRVQTAFIDLYPNNLASRHIREIATKFLEHNVRVKGTLQFFIGNLLSVPARS
ncbi:MAG: MinD/ParA family protein [Nitrospirota bacterium]